MTAPKFEWNDPARKEFIGDLVEIGMCIAHALQMMREKPAFTEKHFPSDKEHDEYLAKQEQRMKAVKEVLRSVVDDLETQVLDDEQLDKELGVGFPMEERARARMSVTIEYDCQPQNGECTTRRAKQVFPTMRAGKKFYEKCFKKGLNPVIVKAEP